MEGERRGRRSAVLGGMSSDEGRAFVFKIVFLNFLEEMFYFCSNFVNYVINNSSKTIQNIINRHTKKSHQAPSLCSFERCRTGSRVAGESDVDGCVA